MLLADCWLQSLPALPEVDGEVLVQHAGKGAVGRSWCLGKRYAGHGSCVMAGYLLAAGCMAGVTGCIAGSVPVLRNARCRAGQLCCGL